MHSCPHCELPLPAGRKLYCDKRCRDRARRRRARGQPASSYPDGGRRGRVPMNEPTKLEAAVAAERAKWNADAILDQLHDATAVFRRRRDDEQGFRVARDTKK